MSKKASLENVDFEGSLTKLEKIVENLEGGELKLEQAMKQFESGVALARLCSDALKQAQERVQTLTIDQGD